MDSITVILLHLTIIDDFAFQEVATSHRSPMYLPCNGSLPFSATAYHKKQYFAFGIWYFSKAMKYSLERRLLFGKASQSEFEFQIKSLSKSHKKFTGISLMSVQVNVRRNDETNK
jgi:hypothetical protein